MNSIDLMRHLADKFHKGQMYGPHPYVYHLEMVASSVAIANKNDERLQVIAWGHDLIEDTECTRDVLNALFDDDVVTAIWVLTKDVGVSYENYLKDVIANPLAREVKKHDAFCNLQESLYRGDMKRVKKYAGILQRLAEGT